MNTIENKVVWSDGLFLLPQHFQQQERYLESLCAVPLAIHPFAWGVLSLQLDQSQIAQGILAVRSGEGIFQDGTPFQFPTHQSSPLPIHLPKSEQDFFVYLGLPNPLASTNAVQIQDGDDGLCRYRLLNEQVADRVTGTVQKVDIQTATQNLQLFVDESELSVSTHDHSFVQSKKDFTYIPIARIKETDQNGAAVIDEDYWAPAIALQALPKCLELLQEIHSLLQYRGQELSVRQGQMSGVSAGAMDFMMLVTINRYMPLLQHVRTLPTCHPERLYSVLIMLAGELATFSRDDKLAQSVKGYIHDRLADSFSPLAAQLRAALKGAIELPALEMPFREVKPGFWQADVNDPELFETDWILAVKADMPTPTLREQMRDGVRLSTIETINDIIRYGVPGIPMNELPVPPSEVKVFQDHVYYQLERSTEQWPQSTSQGFAMKVIGHLPGLTITLWSVRRD